MTITLRKPESIIIFHKKEDYTTVSISEIPLTPRRRALLENEYAVLEQAKEQIPNSFKAPSTISIDKNTGETALEFIHGEKLGTREKLSSIYEEHIPKIAQYLAELRKFNPGKLPNDRLKFMNRSFLNWLSNPYTLKLIWAVVRADRYAHDVKGHGCSGLLKAVDSGDISRMSFNHGEVSPWHLFAKKDDLYLNGWEWASNKYPEHYDLAHPMARLAVQYERPDLAKKLGIEYLKNLPEDEKDYFSRTINSLLAVRTIGELRDLCGGGKQTLKEACESRGKNLELILDFAKQVEKGAVLR